MRATLPPTAADLTETLVKAGALPDGHVREVVVETDRPTLLSRILRLRLTYDRVRPDAPATLILKTGLESPAKPTWNGGHQEVEFYRRIAPMLAGGVVPRCFEAHWDAETQTWYLLLEDLTESHVLATQWPLPPSLEQCEAIMGARARLNAAWWDDARLGVSVGTWTTGADIDAYQQRQQRNFAAFADRCGDILSAERRDLYARFLEGMPRLFQRYHDHRHMTICQGDAHVWNCFLPSSGGDDVRFFDWDLWRLHVAATDLAYMMAVHWYPERRRRMEGPLLDHYHHVLLTHGVGGYNRQMLQQDYRWAVLLQLSTPLLQATSQIPPLVWWNNLERILMAVDDLGCRDLL